MRTGSAILVVVAACASAPLEPELVVIGPAIGSTHVPEMRAIKPVSPAAAPASPAAQRLLAATNELAVDSERRQVAHAFYALADALETVTPGASSEILRVRHSADALDRTGPQRGQAATVRTGLVGATRALDGIDAVIEQPGYRDAVIAMQSAAAAIDPSRPLGEQSPHVREAFREAVRAVFAATGAGEPPIAGAEATARL
jgi:hypothetical protein